MLAFFIFNNLRVDKFRLSDSPLPGFELLVWEDHCKTPGTLWDLGIDAGYTPIGLSDVSGQIWVTESVDKINELEYFLGVNSGLTEPHKIKAYVSNSGLYETFDATIYKLRQIQNMYKIVDDGYWMIRRTK